MKDDNEEEQFEEDVSDIKDSASPVAMSKSKSTIGIILIVIISIILVSYLFFSGDDSAKKKAIAQEELINKANLEEIDNALPVVPVLPEPPKLNIPQAPSIPQIAAPALPNAPAAPAAPAAPPLITEATTTKTPMATPPLPSSSPVITSAPSILGNFGSAKPSLASKVSKEDRLRSPIGSGSDGAGSITDDKSAVYSSDFLMEHTSAAQVRASKIGDIALTIAQGKVIDAVLETAINTDMPGMIRAIISRDIYSEAGKNILLPKGSRLIGTYRSEVKRGEKRVGVVWNRVIRPDGIDVIIDSPGIDQIGRSGVAGDVDNKYFEIIANAVLASTFTVGWAFVTDAADTALKKKIPTSSGNNGGSAPADRQARINALVAAKVPIEQAIAIVDAIGSGGNNRTTTTNTDGSKTTTSNDSVTDAAIRDASTNINDAIKEATKNSLNTTPTITVDQGTKIKVFVQRDLLFPKSSINYGKMIR
jgi:type IV secretion system protein VirB10